MVVNKLWEVSTKASGWYSGGGSGGEAVVPTITDPHSKGKLPASSTCSSPTILSTSSVSKGASSAIANSSSAETVNSNTSAATTSSITALANFGTSIFPVSQMTADLSSSLGSMWDSTVSTFQSASDTTYQTFSYLSSYYETPNDDDNPYRNPLITSGGAPITSDGNNVLSKDQRQSQHQLGILGWKLMSSTSKPSIRRTTLPPEMSWMMTWYNNPYNCVRGRDFEQSSMSAVRDLITLVVPPQSNIESNGDSNDNKSGDSISDNRSIDDSAHESDHTIAMQRQFPNSVSSKVSSVLSKTDDNKQYRWNNLTRRYDPTFSNKTLHRYRPATSSQTTIDGEEYYDYGWNDTSDHGDPIQTHIFRRTTTEGEPLSTPALSEPFIAQQMHGQNPYPQPMPHGSYSASETASQLAEGTLRALRDAALDEAVELQSALRFWTERWERPLLSWIEAGPIVWTSRRGYNHQEVGRKVSLIQAVLARRCAAIGELQQQLLTAGWAKGVAQWGCLGHGSSQWVPATGFDNTKTGESQSHFSTSDLPSHVPDGPAVTGPSTTTPQKSLPQVHVNYETYEQQRLFNIQESSKNTVLKETVDLSSSEVQLPFHNRINPKVSRFQEQSEQFVGLHMTAPPPRSIVQESSTYGDASFEELPAYNLRTKSTTNMQQSQAGVFVQKGHGGGIVVDDPGFLALWSVQALSLVRRHLNRACNGMVPLPFQTNWSKSPDDEGELIVEAAEGMEVPIWASYTPTTQTEPLLNENDSHVDVNRPNVTSTQLIITNLPLMVQEVEALLDVMEDVMIIQRRRRLDKLRAPSWFRCNWYIIASTVPVMAAVVQYFNGRGYEHGKALFSKLVDGIKAFCREHIRDPLLAIANELWKSNENFSDQKARLEAMASLKKMLASWLQDTFPEIPESKRLKMAEDMDVSLLEQRKEEDLKAGLYVMSNLVRMTFIEMQYMKKEMMNALHSIDEMKSANYINMNLAAVTPAFLMAYAVDRTFRYLTYVLLKLGRSREETYASFRLVLTEVERLLVMRDSPPIASYTWNGGNTKNNVVFGSNNTSAGSSSTSSVLNSDDLGMLMLLIHECRCIMWNNRIRFSNAIIRSVSEDLAELAGERGAVSVKQQLRIISRMCRSYPFLKVISTGHIVI